MTKEKTVEDRMSPKEAAVALATALGDSPERWYLRMQNWRKANRRAPVSHERVPGKRPWYRSEDVFSYINSLQQGQAVEPDHAGAEVWPQVDRLRITINWRADHASGRITLTRERAVELGKRLIELGTNSGNSKT